MGEPGHGRRHCRHHYPPECYGVARISLVGSDAWAVWLGPTSSLHAVTFCGKTEAMCTGLSTVRRCRHDKHNSSDGLRAG